MSKASKACVVVFDVCCEECVVVLDLSCRVARLVHCKFVCLRVILC